MSESELRKGYDARRVLIEVEHILTPRFDAQGVYLLGEELEMLRNVTQYLNEQATFVDSYHMDYYMMADSDDWDAIQAVVASIERKLMGNENVLWGYNSEYDEKLGLRTGGPGTAILSGDPVDAGTVRVVQAMSFVNTTGVRGLMRLEVKRPLHVQLLKIEMPTSVNIPILWYGSIVLVEGDIIQCRQFSCLTDDSLEMQAWGYDMLVPE